MKIQFFVLLLFFAATDCVSQTIKTKPAVSNAYHNLNQISLTNYDGTRATIYLNGNSATLFNADGSQSTINSFKDSSNLIASDGTQSTILHNGFSSTVSNSDGTQFMVNHKLSSSTCATGIGIHSITHVFANNCERKYKDQIDVLIHTNWFIQQKQLLAVKVEGIGTQE